jgi:putative membrane protein
MIRNLSDHSANERTFLAWVRTSIAIMAFGFLVERFDLFLAVAAHTLDPAMHLPDRRLGNIAGLALIVLGVAMIVVATVRFRRTARAIDSPDVLARLGSQVDIGLACLLILLGFALFLYLAHAVVTNV